MVEGKKKKEVKNLELGRAPIKYEKQTKITIIIMVILIFSVFLAQWFVQESKKFEYNGLDFYKEKEGNILYYKSILGFASVSGESMPFTVKLRNDPRDLDKIPLNGEIRLKPNAVLSISPKLENCSDAYITIIDFSRSLKTLGIEAEAATTDRNYARENNAKLINCGDANDKTVITIKTGDETRITQKREPYDEIIVGEGGKTTTKTSYIECYALEAANCETQQVFERFLLGLMEQGGF